MSVLIPARNEEALLPRCLASVLSAAAMLPHHVTYDVIVTVDSSFDRTFEIASTMLHGRGTVIRSAFGIVGKARALAAEEALSRSTSPRNRHWLANTDADCEVPGTWLTEQLALADRQVEAVAGIVDVDTFAEHDPRVADRFKLTYVLHDDGTHPHVHGANLCVRADVYLRAGGWASKATAEDHDLWGRLRETGARRVSTDSLKVTTSGRRVGRAPNGFAGALAAHNALPETYDCPSTALIE